MRQLGRKLASPQDDGRFGRCAARHADLRKLGVERQAVEDDVGLVLLGCAGHLGHGGICSHRSESCGPRQHGLESDLEHGLVCKRQDRQWGNVHGGQEFLLFAAPWEQLRFLVVKTAYS